MPRRLQFFSLEDAWRQLLQKPALKRLCLGFDWLDHRRGHKDGYWRPRELFNQLLQVAPPTLAANMSFFYGDDTADPKVISNIALAVLNNVPFEPDVFNDAVKFGAQIPPVAVLICWCASSEALEFVLARFADDFQALDWSSTVLVTELCGSALEKNVQILFKLLRLAKSRGLNLTIDLDQVYWTDRNISHFYPFVLNDERAFLAPAPHNRCLYAGIFLKDHLSEKKFQYAKFLLDLLADDLEPPLEALQVILSGSRRLKKTT